MAQEEKKEKAESGLSRFEIYWTFSTCISFAKVFNKHDVQNVLVSFSSMDKWWCNWEKLEAPNVFLDSGGYSFFQRFTEYPYTCAEYLERVRQVNEAKPLKFIAAMDYPCEDTILKRRGSTVTEHIASTVSNLAEIIEIAEREYPEILSKVVPVVQGWYMDDYLSCIDAMNDIGLLRRAERVGIGSICRRGALKEMSKIVPAIHRALPGKDLHAFGAKISALKKRSIRRALTSIDTAAWNVEAMYSKARTSSKFRLFTMQLPRQLRYEVAFVIYKNKLEALVNGDPVIYRDEKQEAIDKWC